MLPCVFVGHYYGTLTVEPFVSVRMVEMPVCIDHIPDRSTPKAFDSFNYSLSIGVVTGPLIGSQKGPLPLVASGQRA